MRLVELRVLDGPNIYRLEPTIKIEVAVGRRRSWYGQRMPGRYAIVQLRAPVPASRAPESVVTLARWVARLHELTGSDAPVLAEPAPDGRPRRRLPVTIHRSSEPGHWIVTFPWRQRERAEAIANAAFRLTDADEDPAVLAPPGRDAPSRRRLPRTLAAIESAASTPPPWITDDQRRIPTVSITGTNGKSTTTRMITRIFRIAGRRTGTTMSDGVLIDEQFVEQGDLTGPYGARSVLRRPDVEIAVLETARGGIVLKGLAYQSNDASVFTNVSADHLDLLGIHTLPELAEVKSVICRVTRPTGTVVLNADDPLVAAVARHVRARVCFFSLDPGSRRIRRHLSRGRSAVLLEDGWIVEAEGDERRPIIDVRDVPATLLGLARHNVANALAAAGGARAFGATIEQVAAGLRDFRPSSDQAFGRMNLYRLGDRVVIVDFAHNEAGVAAMLEVAKGVAGKGRPGARPITAIIGTAGDRPDDALRGVGRSAARGADHLVIKETRKYLRGRTPEHIVGELLAGMAEEGARPSDVPLYPDEVAALRGVIAGDGQPHDARERGVIFLMCQADREGVVAALAELGAEPLDADGLSDVLRPGSIQVARSGAEAV